MGQALYRAHRPKKLSEIVGQEHISSALTRALEKGTISHAYLFTGPRGVGKTSIARILAHEINGLPYDDDSTHLDIIEIDAASNRRIDEIRDLRDKVHIAPTSAKYKVYIIDEVHMLTKEAFNALLKTLEEPPAHVVFILATTEVQKLPETIISRTQRYAFKPVEQTKVIGHLKAIAQQEGINVDDDALALIAAHGEGSFRDSISLLDQVRNSGEKVALADVQSMLGIAPKEHIEQLVHALSAHDAAAIVTTLVAMRAAGYEPSQIARQLGGTLREALLASKGSMPRDILLPLLTKLIEVANSSDPQSYLEVILLDAAFSGIASKPAPSKTMAVEVEAKAAVQIEPHPSSLRKADPKSTPVAPAIAIAKPSPTPVDDDQPRSVSTAQLDKSCWPNILAAVKAKHNTLYSIVRLTSPAFTPGEITLTCGFAFHQKRLSENRNKQMLGEIVKDITGEDLRITCVLGEVTEVPVPAGPAVLPPDTGEISHSVATAPTSIPATPPAVSNEAVSAISNIFGGAEVLES